MRFKWLAMRLVIAPLVVVIVAAMAAVPAAAQLRLIGGAPTPEGNASRAVPKIQLVDPVYDFGSAPEGKMVRHAFKIRNAGQANLVIRGTKTSCGCTAALPARHFLRPDEETEISVDFDTRFQKGDQVRTITVITNDPVSPRAVMTMQGVVKPLVSVTPPQVAFGRVHKGTERSTEVVIGDLGSGGRFKVGPLSNSNPNIEVTRKSRSDGKPGAVLRVKLLKSMPVGPFNDTVEVVTNRVPVQVSVFGTITGDLEVDPPQVSFGIVPPGRDVVRILKLTNVGKRKVRVLGISSTSTSVVASARAVAPGKEYKIRVTLRRGTPEGQLRGKLAIRTDDPEQATVNVPFYGVVGQFKI